MTRSDDLLARAKRPAADALRLHPYTSTRTRRTPSRSCRTVRAFSGWATSALRRGCRDDETVIVREAVAVAMKAQEQGVARLTRDDLARTAEVVMREAKRATRALMEAGLIREMPGEDA